MDLLEPKTNTGMKKQTIWIVVILSIIGLGILIYFLFFKKKAIVNSNTNVNTNNNTNVGNGFPLKFGSTGANVSKLQTALLKMGELLPSFGVDGIMKDETIAAIISLGFTVPLDEMSYNYIIKDAESRSQNQQNQSMRMQSQSVEINKNEVPKIDPRKIELERVLMIL